MWNANFKHIRSTVLSQFGCRFREDPISNQTYWLIKPEFVHSTFRSTSEFVTFHTHSNSRKILYKLVQKWQNARKWQHWTYNTQNTLINRFRLGLGPGLRSSPVNAQLHHIIGHDHNGRPVGDTCHPSLRGGTTDGPTRRRKVCQCSTGADPTARRAGPTRGAVGPARVAGWAFAFLHFNNFNNFAFLYFQSINKWRP